MEINRIIASELNLNVEKIDSAVQLLDGGDTVPFIARYRKEVTGGLTDEDLRNIEERLIALRNLEDRKKTVIKSLDDQKIDDPELRKKIDECLTMSVLEDLYRPYKPKRVTRASKAIKAGLKPLSEYLLTDKTGGLEEEAKKYLCEDYKTIDKVIQGAFDILAEQISDNPNYRTYIKNFAHSSGHLTSTKLEDADSDVYDNYAEYDRLLSKVKPYHTLAINRGTVKKCLAKKIVLDDETILNHIKEFEIPRNTPYRDLFETMVKDSYDRLIYPSVSNDLFAELTEVAEDSSIEEFKTSLRATLLYPPLKGRKVLGFDPGFTHGCKLAFVDENGKVIDTFVLKDPFHSTYGYQQAKKDLIRLIQKNGTYTIALGNGTASRESEKLLKELKAEEMSMSKLEIAIVSESGASIYSATALAQKEFPDFEPNLRSAVSIARRLQDPLAELVKIPPESIGVGQYQYDIDPKKLSLALKGVVEDCVNYVGVNLNTASASLLSYVAGINMKVAENIVKYREENGSILSRKQLLKVPSLGEKCFLNCAGFLRIPESKEELDNTAVHPESYPIARALLEKARGITQSEKKESIKAMTEDELRTYSLELGVGLPTLVDIRKELVQPSRDPRDEAKTATLLEGVTDIKDLKVGMTLEGTIRNVAGFGFFVDIGVEINGLVHISEIADHYVDDPHKEGKPGDIVKVKVKEIDLKRSRISLTMKGLKKEN